MLNFYIHNGFLGGRRCYSKHGALASRVRAPTKGCQTVALICPVGNGRTRDAECFIKGDRVGVLSPRAGG